jgi:hypothetical protein
MYGQPAFVNKNVYPYPPNTSTTQAPQQQPKNPYGYNQAYNGTYEEGLGMEYKQQLNFFPNQKPRQQQQQRFDKSSSSPSNNQTSSSTTTPQQQQASQVQQSTQGQGQQHHQTQQQQQQNVPFYGNYYPMMQNYGGVYPAQPVMNQPPMQSMQTMHTQGMHTQSMQGMHAAGVQGMHGQGMQGMQGRGQFWSQQQS